DCQAAPHGEHLLFCLETRGRKPNVVTTVNSRWPGRSDPPRGCQARQLAWFQVQRARIVMAVAAGEPIAAIAARLKCDPATVWRVGRRYEQGGLALTLGEVDVSNHCTNLVAFSLAFAFVRKAQRNGSG